MSIRRIEWLHGGMLAAFTVAALLTGWLEGGSLLLGGGVMWANLRLLTAIVARLVQPNVRAGWAILLVVTKFGLFLGLLGLLLWRVPVEGLSFAVGVTLLLVACVIEALRAPRHLTNEGTT